MAAHTPASMQGHTTYPPYYYYYYFNEYLYYYTWPRTRRRACQSAHTPIHKPTRTSTRTPDVRAHLPAVGGRRSALYRLSMSASPTACLLRGHGRLGAGIINNYIIIIIINRYIIIIIVARAWTPRRRGFPNGAMAHA